MSICSFSWSEFFAWKNWRWRQVLYTSPRKTVGLEVHRRMVNIRRKHLGRTELNQSVAPGNWNPHCLWLNNAAGCVRTTVFRDQPKCHGYNDEGKATRTDCEYPSFAWGSWGIGISRSPSSASIFFAKKGPKVTFLLRNHLQDIERVRHRLGGWKSFAIGETTTLSNVVDHVTQGESCR
jgi:hypothetical protein